MNANELVRSSPLDGFTILYSHDTSTNIEPNTINQSPTIQTALSTLSDNQSIVSVDSTLTTGRLLDKLELSQEDEILFQQLIENEKNDKVLRNHYSSNNSPNFSNQNADHFQKKITSKNSIKSPDDYSTNSKTNYLSHRLSVPASQFLSLKKYNSSNYLKNRLSNINNIHKTSSAYTNNNNDNINTSYDNNINKRTSYHDYKNSIKNMLEKNVTFTDNSLTSSVEEHYANVTRFSYIVEEDLSDTFDSHLPNSYSGSAFINKNCSDKNILSDNATKKDHNFLQAENINKSTSPFGTFKKDHHFNNMNSNKIFVNKQDSFDTSSNTLLGHTNKMENSGNAKNQKTEKCSSSTNYPKFEKKDAVNSRIALENRNKFHEMLNTDDFAKFKKVKSTDHLNNKLRINRDNKFDQLVGTFNNFSSTNTNSDSNSRSASNNYNKISSQKVKNLNDEQHKSISVNENKPSHHYYRNIALGNHNKNNLCKSNSSRSDCNVERNESYGSTNSRNTQFSNNIQLTNKFTQVSNETDLTCESPISKSKAFSPSPPSERTSPIRKMNYTPIEGMHSSPTPSFKTHKKQSSLSSLKNLFKTPKSKEKNKKISSNSTTSLEKTYSKHIDCNSSFESVKQNTFIESSPSASNKKSMSKLIFSPHPVLYSNQIIQEFNESFSSDKPNCADFDNSASLPNSSNSHIYHHRSRSDFQSSVSPPVLSSSKHSRNKSFHSDSVEFNKTSYTHQTNFPPGNNFTNQNLISSAIDMRKEGKLRESSQKLYDACKTGNHTAFLLYGLALRYGYGVKIDLVKSLEYLQMATGLTDLERDVISFHVNPFELEIHPERIPKHISEPFVPAIHECGIAYLKDFGNGKTNQWKGLKFLEKAASLGHVDSMCLSGIIWSQDDTSGISDRKKDLIRAATWFRIAYSKGANLIGSDWIYKKKYIQGAERRD